MEWLAAYDYWTAREILQRGVALIYLIAFISTLNQFPALAGEHGPGRFSFSRNLV